jgi:hypothetical protein
VDASKRAHIRSLVFTELLLDTTCVPTRPSMRQRNPQFKSWNEPAHK